jgi:cytochrome b561
MTGDLVQRALKHAPGVMRFLLAVGSVVLLSWLAGRALAGDGFDGKAPWYISRAAGITAYLLLTASTAFGLLLSTRTAASRLRGPTVFALHEQLSWLALGLLALHVGALLVDTYEPFSVAGVLVPFVADYRPAWTALGIIGLYTSIALTASLYVRDRIGQRGWRTLHYGSFGLYVIATLHGLLAGNSTGQAWMQWLYLASGALVLGLTLYRILLSRPNRAARPAPPVRSGGPTRPASVVLSTARPFAVTSAARADTERALRVWQRPERQRAD